MLKIDKRPFKRLRYFKPLKSKQEEKFLSSVSDGYNAITIEFNKSKPNKIHAWFNREPIKIEELFSYLHKLNGALDFDSLYLAVFIDNLIQHFNFKNITNP